MVNGGVSEGNGELKDKADDLLNFLIVIKCYEKTKTNDVVLVCVSILSIHYA